MRVEELAGARGLSVDTVRYYQKLGLLHAPQRVGRVVEYDEGHARRLDEIRRLSDAGFSLAQIRRLSDTAPAPLLRVLTDEPAGPAAGRPTLSLAELAAAAGVDLVVCKLAADAGLIWPAGEPAGERRFGADAVEMMRTGSDLLDAGVPLDELMAIAARHASGIDDVVSAAVELFARHLRPGASGRGETDGDLASLVERLVPLVTDLVAQHFRRTLIAKATDRLLDDHDETARTPAKAPK
ncbi:MAG TPA: hypothetical protein DEP66_06430 [Acidimicrobiaceae bacterium]|nr:hypothetical protein [Acidimicrobiaceae bacterium]HCB37821.1 hypothetical protein [Acidimicrobiaceae bacterium]